MPISDCLKYIPNLTLLSDFLSSKSAKFWYGDRFLSCIYLVSSQEASTDSFKYWCFIISITFRSSPTNTDIDAFSFRMDCRMFVRLSSL